MQVRDIMTPEPLRVQSSATLTAAIALLALGEVRHLPVVDDGGGVVGMLSERDALGFLVPGRGEVEQRLEEGLSRPVTEVMSREVLTIAPDASVRDLIDLLVDNQIGAAPVVEGDELVGIASYVDVLRAVRDRV